MAQLICELCFSSARIAFGTRVQALRDELEEL